MAERLVAGTVAHGGDARASAELRGIGAEVPLGDLGTVAEEALEAGRTGLDIGVVLGHDPGREVIDRADLVAGIGGHGLLVDLGLHAGDVLEEGAHLGEQLLGRLAAGDAAVAGDDSLAGDGVERGRLAVDLGDLDGATAEERVLHEVVERIDALHDGDGLDEGVVAAPGRGGVRRLARHGDADERPALVAAHQAVGARFGDQDVVGLDIGILLHHGLDAGALDIFLRDGARHPQREIALEPQLLDGTPGEGDAREAALVVHRAAAADHIVHDLGLERVVHAPVGGIADLDGVRMGIVEQDAAAVAHAPHTVARGIHAHLVEAELPHLGREEPDGLALVVGDAVDGDELEQELHDLVALAIHVGGDHLQLLIKVAAHADAPSSRRAGSNRISLYLVEGA